MDTRNRVREGSAGAIAFLSSNGGPRAERGAKGQPRQSCNFAETAQLFRSAPQFSGKSMDFPNDAKGSEKRRASHQGFRDHPKASGGSGHSKTGKLRTAKRFMRGFPEIARIRRPAFREGLAAPRKGGRRHGRRLARPRRKTRSGQRKHPWRRAHRSRGRILDEGHTAAVDASSSEAGRPIEGAPSAEVGAPDRNRPLGRGGRQCPRRHASNRLCRRASL